MPDDIKPILTFRRVTFRATSHLADDVADASFDILPSQLMLLRLDRQTEDVPFFDLAEGLERPDSGVVEFLGEDWQSLSAFDQARRRGRIGRVFEGQAWVSNLDVYENLVLAQRHHTARTESELREEAALLMREAGFATIPVGRTHLLRRHELQQAQWARAFMGRPALVLLDEAETDVPPDSVERLIAMVQERLAQGTAIIWSTTDARIWQHEALKGSRRFSLAAGRLAGVEGNA